MHEMALAEGIIQALEDQARQQAFTRVKTIWLDIGRLSHVEAEAIEFCFESVREGTLAGSAELKIRLIDGQGQCGDCRQTFVYNQLYDPCPFCNGYLVHIRDGDQMRIRELEVE